MVGRLILIKHVIQSIPVYYLMLFELSGNGYHQLEVVCREFFWSLGEQGNLRIPLVAWENIQEFLLLSPKAHIPSRTLRGVLAGWTIPSAILSLRQGHLPEGMTMVQLYYLCHRGLCKDSDELRDLAIWTGSRGIKKVQDLRIGDNWGSIEQLGG